MEFRVTKLFKFEAAHFLPEHPGKCKNLHGHTYHLEVTVGSNRLNSSGMVIDFGDLKKIVGSGVIDKFDHSYLNDCFSNPTAEILCSHIGVVLKDWIKVLGHDIYLVSVKLWETPDSYAEVIL